MSGATSPPLVVDLDGALLAGSLLGEAINQFVTRDPLICLRSVRWLLRGRRTLEAQLTERCGLNPVCLPYRPGVVEWLRAQKDEGRRLVLSTRYSRQWGEAVESHLGLFDDVIVAEDRYEAELGCKHEVVVGRYGEGGYDYLGAHTANLPLWQKASQAYITGASPALEAKVASFGNLAGVVGERRGSPLLAMIRALRPHQWIKNLLVLVPLLFAHLYTDVASILHAVLALVVFCLLASSAYVLNDLVDLVHDRQDPGKHRRPLARGEMSVLNGWLVWPALLVAAFALAGALLPVLFVATMAFYFVLTCAYSFRLKRLVVVDVLALATLYTARVVAGAAAIRVTPSFWLLAFSIFFFLSLAFIKRYSALKATREANGEVGLRGRNYLAADLEIVSSLGVAAGYMAVLVLALYINDSHTAELYRTPRIIWLACPVLLFWITRVWLLAHRGAIDDDPIVFAIRDRTSWAVAVLLVLLFILARVIP